MISAPTPLSDRSTTYAMDLPGWAEVVPAEFARWLERSMNEYKEELQELKASLNAGDQPKQQVDPV